MEKSYGVDVLHMNGSGMTAVGNVAQKLLANNMDPSVLKPWIGNDGRSYMTVMNGGQPAVVPIANAATLRKDEWKHLDTAVMKAARDRLVGVADLIRLGLTYSVGNGLGKTVLEYEDVSELTEAELSMDGVTPSQKDRPEYDIKYLPLPIIHKDFSYNVRALAASRSGSMPLDTTTAEMASRKVSELLETILFQGYSSYKFGGGTIYGYTDHPSANSVTLSVAWTDSGKTGSDILDDVREMKQASIDAKHYGPWILYVPTEYETVLDDDYKSESDKTVRERILGISGINEVKVADKCPAGKCVLVETQSSTVRVVEGLPIQTIEWQVGGGMTTNYKVMTIMVPQIRADQEGNCGVTVLSA